MAGFAFVHASRGIEWSRRFHPDERPISKWIGQTYERGYVTDRLYPGGWFVLMNLRTAVGEGVHNLSRRWRDLRNQDGAVDATDADSFESDPRRERFDIGGAQSGRDFNVLLFAGAVLFLFLAAREAGAGPAASTLAALLLAVQPYPLEHVHYCETDIAPFFALCFSLWLANGAIRRASPGRCAAALAAAGFAVACKYTLAPILVWIPALAAAVSAGRRGGRPRGRAFLMLFATGLLVALAGFLAGTPALWRDPDFFLSGLSGRGGSTARALGAGHSYLAGVLWRLDSLAKELLRMGAAPLLFFLAGLVSWFRRANRRWLPAAPLFLAAFLPFAAFVMPWIRNQEMLPILPCACLGGALALSWAGSALRRGARRDRRRAVFAAGLLVLFAAAFVRSAADGGRILSCFQRRDTRAECQNWLACSARPGVSLALDHYVEQTIRGTECTGTECWYPAETWPEKAGVRDAGGDRPGYLLRNASFAGRRVRGAEAKEAAARFNEECPVLVSWTIVPGTARTITFAQPDAELRAMPYPDEEATAPDIRVCLDRPFFFSPGLRPLYAPGGPALVGPVRGVQTVGSRHVVHPPPGGRCWAVTQVLDGPKEGVVVWEGPFGPRRVPLSPAGVAVARLNDAAFRRKAMWDVRPLARVRLRGADDQATVCATRLCSDPAEVARILRRAGDPAAALAFLRTVPEPDAAARVEAFLAAVGSGAAPEPAWTKAAREAVAAFCRVEASGRPALRVRGVPLRVLRDFARVRIGDWHGLPVRGDLPVFLPQGRYALEATLKDGRAGPSAGLWYAGQERPVERKAGGEGREVRTATVRQVRDGLLRDLADDTGPDDGSGRDVLQLSIEWDPLEQLERTIREISASLPPPEQLEQ